MDAANMAVNPPTSATTTIIWSDAWNRREESRHEEHARRNHGRGVYQRANRRWAFHRVRQPGVERELPRLSDGAREYAERYPGGYPGSYQP